MDIKKIQTRLAAAGRDPGPIDGILGQRTYRALLDYMARRPLGTRGDGLAEGCAKHFPAYSINTELRLAHFMAQATHETCDFCFLIEKWGPTQAQRRYEGRVDLGNVRPGDGYLYRGRGIFQLTGRKNYSRIGAALALPLETEPALAADPVIAVRIACHYWMVTGLNAWADKDDLLAVSRGINCKSPTQGNPNGFPARQRALARAKAVLCA